MPKSVSSKPTRLPVLPLSGSVLFPDQTLTLAGLDALSPAALKEARAGGFRLLALPLTEGDKPAGHGTEAVVEQVIRLPSGETGAVVRGLSRCKVLGLTTSRGRMTALVTPLADREPVARLRGHAALRRALRLAATRVAELKAAQSGAHPAQLPEEADRLCFRMLGELPLPQDEKLALLGVTDAGARERRLLAALTREEKLLELATRIRDKASLGVQESQRRHLLKEQVRLLQEELGEDNESDELQDLRDDMAILDLPPEVREAVDRELGRMDLMPTGSPDYMVSFNYLSWIKELPWGSATLPPPPSLSTARRALNQQHYGLGQVKERILEYLAVMRQKGQSHGEILLLAGPPGVGKSSLARQIAVALGRPFVSVALGGVKDEAEIRGHRRTYVGAMPGKLLHAMRQAKSRAPVILLDEIDKVGLDQGRGSLSSALLEVLDYGQNHAFTDHYLGLPYDLSDVVFIATANSTDPIPGPLLDRMELVELPSYTEGEKLQIAEKHLLPELRTELGLGKRHLQLPESVIRDVVRLYTREAGVRQLRRELASVGRKAVKAIADGRKPRPVTQATLPQFLGPPRFLDEPNDARLVPGVSLGLAYTEFGGEILYIESTRLPGAGKAGLSLTGSLGKVMKESAQAGLAYLRSLAYARPDLLALPSLEDGHIHLHLPAGATPKDGPSAGLAIVCAVASLLADKALPARLAMTGEITLRGQVLPVGGIKEKLLAAHRYGKTRVIMPAANQHDLAQLPKAVLRELEIVPVQTVEEALAAAGLTQPQTSRRTRGNRPGERPVPGLRLASQRKTRR